MISLIICNGVERELRDMDAYAHYLAAKLSEEEWKYYLFHDSEALNSFLKKEPVFDIVCVDLTVLAEINIVEKIRKMN